uniref:DDE Tnp4 domain-containing protein n=1 Tax=Sander lucioperca TaxID=283035 RepID=A0A8C9XPS4_SANLU
IYLASGDSLISLAFNFRLGHITVMNSVRMVCAAIEKVMMQTFLPRPTAHSWKEVAQRFWDKWNFPNCLGALDGKHIVIQAPPLSGSQYFNYKKTFSIVLLALVDAAYQFRCIHVGDFGRTSDGGNNTLDVPTSTSLPGAAHLGDVPHVMVGDAAFPLKARMVVENAFGILASRWRIFHRGINLHPKNVDTLVVAACILHNFLLAPSENVRLLEEADELGRHMAPVRNMGGNRASMESFATFLSSPEGSVSWQDRMV